MSHETIANITDAINEQVKEWRNRPLDEVYPIVYIDAIWGVSRILDKFSLDERMGL